WRSPARRVRSVHGGDASGPTPRAPSEPREPPLPRAERGVSCFVSSPHADRRPHHLVPPLGGGSIRPFRALLGAGARRGGARGPRRHARRLAAREAGAGRPAAAPPRGGRLPLRLAGRGRPPARGALAAPRVGRVRR